MRVLFVSLVCLGTCLGYMRNIRPIVQRQQSRGNLALRHSINDDLVAGSLKEGKLDVRETFSALAKNEEFQKEIWQKRPYICTAKLANIAGAFTMDDVQV